ncbi:hypothetical protein PSCLAVI8L_130622 [Pseudoclavibacter sp. 8L]|nr:hypothetical protein PSCLAVI8L_130622 [Pseudoclavibacter sp. 8L]
MRRASAHSSDELPDVMQVTRRVQIPSGTGDHSVRQATRRFRLGNDVSLPRTDSALVR